jgi:arylsulfatase A-like enzyme
MAPEAYEHPPPATAIENFGDVIEDYYVYVDSSLGRILEGMPGNPTVILISDHGMHASNRGKRFDPDDLPMDVSSGGHGDAPPGILIAAGPRIVPRPPSKPLASLERSDLAEVGSIFDITPTLLALLDLPPGADMPGRVLTELIDVPSEQIRRIPSHDSVAWRAQRASLTGDDVQPRAEEARLEQLRALGYIR